MYSTDYVIEADATIFPNNIVNLLATRFAAVTPGLEIKKRPLVPSDPRECLGISAVTWDPQNDTWEIRGEANFGPTLSRYIIGIQALVTDMDEESGLARHATLSNIVRRTIYRDNPLKVGLSLLSASSGGSVEKYQRHQVQRQQFFSNQLGTNKSFIYLSVLEFYLETEME